MRYELRDENSRKRPAWMIDYDDINSNDDVYFDLFTNSDPITFDEAVKKKKL